MSKRRITVTATAASLLAVGALVGSAISPADADIAPQKNDVVGVGSDVVQNALDFLADGLGKTKGFNETKAAKKWRVFNFDASGDANGTATNNATIVLEAGGNTYNRPKGGSDGLAALENDGSNGTSAGLIDFARTPSALTATDEANAVANLGTHLDWVTLATDTDYIAVTKSTNAPSTLSPQALFAIYTGTYDGSPVTTWGELAATGLVAGWTPKSGTANNKILAFYPQNGAGMQKVFLSGLASANGGTAPAATALVNGYQVKQNDPTTLVDPSKAVDNTGKSYGFSASQADDVIVPLPLSKYALFSQGYYNDGSKPYSAADGSQSPVSVSNVQLLQSAGNFTATVQFNVAFRDADYTASDTKKQWQPGSRLNWVHTLFYNPKYNPAKKKNKVAAPFAFSKPYQKLLKSLGLTPIPYSAAFHSYSEAK